MLKYKIPQIVTLTRFTLPPLCLYEDKMKKDR